MDQNTVRFDTVVFRKLRLILILIFVIFRHLPLADRALHITDKFFAFGFSRSQGGTHELRHLECAGYPPPCQQTARTNW